MARKCLFAKEERKKMLVEKYRKVRQQLKESGEWEKLQELPRNSNPIRLHNRCQSTGRPRAYLRKFGISRLVFREKALRGELPGVKKASW